MENRLLLFFGATFVVTSIILLFFSRERRHVLVNRIQFRHRRATSGSKTPPRSLSPKVLQKQEPTDPDYSDIYPPSRRFVLTEVPGLTSKLIKTDEQFKTFQEKREDVPLLTELEDAKKTMLTPCGFSVGEIEAMGNFPDYAALSGIPLPQPYLEFDITKAKPRPYRPFRWAYHQTMCMYKCRYTYARWCSVTD